MGQEASKGEEGQPAAVGTNGGPAQSVRRDQKQKQQYLLPNEDEDDINKNNNNDFHTRSPRWEVNRAASFTDLSQQNWTSIGNSHSHSHSHTTEASSHMRSQSTSALSASEQQSFSQLFTPTNNDVNKNNPHRRSILPSPVKRSSRKNSFRNDDSLDDDDDNNSNMSNSSTSNTNRPLDERTREEEKKDPDASSLSLQLVPPFSPPSPVRSIQSLLNDSHEDDDGNVEVSLHPLSPLPQHTPEPVQEEEDDEDDTTLHSAHESHDDVDMMDGEVLLDRLSQFRHHGDGDHTAANDDNDHKNNDDDDDDDDSDDAFEDALHAQAHHLLNNDSPSAALAFLLQDGESVEEQEMEQNDTHHHSNAAVSSLEAEHDNNNDPNGGSATASMELDVAHTQSTEYLDVSSTSYQQDHHHHHYAATEDEEEDIDNAANAASDASPWLRFLEDEKDVEAAPSGDTAPGTPASGSSSPVQKNQEDTGGDDTDALEEKMAIGEEQAASPVVVETNSQADLSHSAAPAAATATTNDDDDTNGVNDDRATHGADNDVHARLEEDGRISTPVDDNDKTDASSQPRQPMSRADNDAISANENNTKADPFAATTTATTATMCNQESAQTATAINVESVQPETCNQGKITVDGPDLMLNSHHDETENGKQSEAPGKQDEAAATHSAAKQDVRQVTELESSSNFDVVDDDGRGGDNENDADRNETSSQPPQQDHATFDSSVEYEEDNLLMKATSSTPDITTANDEVDVNQLESRTEEKIDHFHAEEEITILPNTDDADENDSSTTARISLVERVTRDDNAHSDPTSQGNYCLATDSRDETTSESTNMDLNCEGASTLTTVRRATSSSTSGNRIEVKPGVLDVDNDINSAIRSASANPLEQSEQPTSERTLLIAASTKEPSTATRNTNQESLPDPDETYRIDRADLSAQTSIEDKEDTLATRTLLAEQSKNTEEMMQTIPLLDFSSMDVNNAAPIGAKKTKSRPASPLLAHTKARLRVVPDSELHAETAARSPYNNEAIIEVKPEPGSIIREEGEEVSSAETGSGKMEEDSQLPAVRSEIACDDAVALLESDPVSEDAASKEFDGPSNNDTASNDRVHAKYIALAKEGSPAASMSVSTVESQKSPGTENVTEYVMLAGPASQVRETEEQNIAPDSPPPPPPPAGLPPPVATGEAEGVQKALASAPVTTSAETPERGRVPFEKTMDVIKRRSFLATSRKTYRSTKTNGSDIPSTKQDSRASAQVEAPEKEGVSFETGEEAHSTTSTLSVSSNTASPEKKQLGISMTDSLLTKKFPVSDKTKNPNEDLEAAMLCDSSVGDGNTSFSVPPPSPHTSGMTNSASTAANWRSLLNDDEDEALLTPAQRRRRKMLRKRQKRKESKRQQKLDNTGNQENDKNSDDSMAAAASGVPELSNMGDCDDETGDHVTASKNTSLSRNSIEMKPLKNQFKTALTDLHTRKDVLSNESEHQTLPSAAAKEVETSDFDATCNIPSVADLPTGIPNLEFEDPPTSLNDSKALTELASCTDTVEASTVDVTCPGPKDADVATGHKFTSEGAALVPFESQGLIAKASLVDEREASAVDATCDGQNEGESLAAIITTIAVTHAAQSPDGVEDAILISSVDDESPAADAIGDGPNEAKPQAATTTIPVTDAAQSPNVVEDAILTTPADDDVQSPAVDAIGDCPNEAKPQEETTTSAEEAAQLSGGPDDPPVCFSAVDEASPVDATGDGPNETKPQEKIAITDQEATQLFDGADNHALVPSVVDEVDAPVVNAFGDGLHEAKPQEEITTTVADATELSGGADDHAIISSAVDEGEAPTVETTTDSPDEAKPPEGITVTVERVHQSSEGAADPPVLPSASVADEIEASAVYGPHDAKLHGEIRTIGEDVAQLSDGVADEIEASAVYGPNEAKPPEEIRTRGEDVAQLSDGADDHVMLPCAVDKVEASPADATGDCPNEAATGTAAEDAAQLFDGADDHTVFSSDVHEIEAPAISANGDGANEAKPQEEIMNTVVEAVELSGEADDHVIVSSAVGDVQESEQLSEGTAGPPVFPSTADEVKASAINIGSNVVDSQARIIPIKDDDVGQLSDGAEDPIVMAFGVDDVDANVVGINEAKSCEGMTTTLEKTALVAKGYKDQRIVTSAMDDADSSTIDATLDGPCKAEPRMGISTTAVDADAESLDQSRDQLAVTSDVDEFIGSAIYATCDGPNEGELQARIATGEVDDAAQSSDENDDQPVITSGVDDVHSSAVDSTCDGPNKRDPRAGISTTVEEAAQSSDESKDQPAMSCAVHEKKASAADAATYCPYEANPEEGFQPDAVDDAARLCDVSEDPTVITSGVDGVDTSTIDETCDGPNEKDLQARISIAGEEAAPVPDGSKVQSVMTSLENDVETSAVDETSDSANETMSRAGITTVEDPAPVPDGSKNTAVVTSAVEEVDSSSADAASDADLSFGIPTAAIRDTATALDGPKDVSELTSLMNDAEAFDVDASCDGTNEEERHQVSDGSFALASATCVKPSDCEAVVKLCDGLDGAGSVTGEHVAPRPKESEDLVTADAVKSTSDSAESNPLSENRHEGSAQLDFSLLNNGKTVINVASSAENCKLSDGAFEQDLPQNPTPYGTDVVAELHKVIKRRNSQILPGQANESIVESVAIVSRTQPSPTVPPDIKNLSNVEQISRCSTGMSSLPVGAGGLMTSAVTVSSQAVKVTSASIVDLPTQSDETTTLGTFSTTASSLDTQQTPKLVEATQRQQGAPSVDQGEVTRPASGHFVRTPNDAEIVEDKAITDTESNFAHKASSADPSTLDLNSGSSELQLDPLDQSVSVLGVDECLAKGESTMNLNTKMAGFEQQGMVRRGATKAYLSDHNHVRESATHTGNKKPDNKQWALERAANIADERNDTEGCDFNRSISQCVPELHTISAKGEEVDSVNAETLNSNLLHHDDARLLARSQSNLHATTKNDAGSLPILSDSNNNGRGKAEFSDIHLAYDPARMQTGQPGCGTILYGTEPNPDRITAPTLNDPLANISDLSGTSQHEPGLYDLHIQRHNLHEAYEGVPVNNSPRVLGQEQHGIVLCPPPYPTRYANLPRSPRTLNRRTLESNSAPSPGPTFSTPQRRRPPPRYSFKSPNKSNKPKRLADIIRRELWSPDPVTVEDSLKKLSDLAATEAATIARTGGLLAVVQSMEHHHDHTGIQIAACKALEKLALDHENEVAIAEVGGLEAILNAMTTHFDDQSVQEAAWSALWNLTCHNGDTTLDDPDSSIDDFPSEMQLLVNCMVAHADSAPVQSNACGTLANLCQSPDRFQAMRKAGGLVAIATALEKHWDNAEVRQEASYAMISLLEPQAESYDVGIVYESTGGNQDIEGCNSIVEIEVETDEE